MPDDRLSLSQRLTFTFLPESRHAEGTDTVYWAGVPPGGDAQ